MSKILYIFSFIFLLFSVGCNGVQPQNLNNVINVTPTPPMEEIVETSNGNRKFINPGGWQIPMPMPEDRKKTKESKTYGTTSDGERVDMTITFYAPIKDFFYTLVIDPAFREHAVGGDLILELIGELKTNGKVYGYSIFARQVAPKDKDGNFTASDHNHMFVYRCYDSDGDGKFETLLTDSSPYFVPDWVLK